MLSLVLIKHHAMKTYGSVEVQLHSFFSSALDRGEWLASLPGRLYPRYPLGGSQSRSGRGS
jgi:hypothetical protein